MRLLSDMIDQLSTTVRLIAGLITLCVMGFGAMMTFGASVVAPQVAADFSEKAEKIAEKELAARLEAQRARELARDGWGYDAADGYRPSSGAAQERDSSGEAIGGWGD
ncbi:MAG: hypothetical protein V2I39_02330 [Erythrobacter sp.]|jgi:hypothetical protein|nr:hypothetical protein [Erythrobacter sp.]